MRVFSVSGCSGNGGETEGGVAVVVRAKGMT